jgi:lipoprotein
MKKKDELLSCGLFAVGSIACTFLSAALGAVSVAKCIKCAKDREQRDIIEKELKKLDL